MLTDGCFLHNAAVQLSLRRIPVTPKRKPQKYTHGRHDFRVKLEIRSDKLATERRAVDIGRRTREKQTRVDGRAGV